MQIDFEQYVDNVYRFALSLTRDQHLAEDLAQECFLKAVSKTDQLKKHSAVKAWLFQILVNLWKDRIKKKQIELSEIEPLELPCPGDGPEIEMDRNEENEAVLKLMRSLPDRQQSVLFLNAVEKLSPKEISQLLEITENSVKANLSIARKTMRKKLLNQPTRTTPTR